MANLLEGSYRGWLNTLPRTASLWLKLTGTNIMFDVIHTLQGWFANKDDVYVIAATFSFITSRVIPENTSPRLLGRLRCTGRLTETSTKRGKKASDVIEIISKTTKREDQTKKHRTYRDIWKVREYFLSSIRWKNTSSLTLQGFPSGRRRVPGTTTDKRTIVE